MENLSPLISKLADQLARMEIASLVYFHTDHFEPWREIGDTVPAVGQEIVDSIGEFVRTCDRIDFARRLTLFYKPHLNYALRRDDGLARARPDDLVCFLPRSEAEERFGRAAMQNVAGKTEHEIQLHIHHEYFTATKVHTDPDAIRWFASPVGRALDPERLALSIRLNREIIARETDRRLDKWFFIHGQWALNGSDDHACTINNEVEVLMRNGCLGDFTFPARPAVNPRIQIPYFCHPVALPKGYDKPEADPEPAAGNVAAAKDKFFIWACAAKSSHCSLDYMTESSRRYLDDTERAATTLIEDSYRTPRTLFIKTHGHSMHAYYFARGRSPVFPHQYPATQTLLSVIFDAAARAGTQVRFLTASEVYHSLLTQEPRPSVISAQTHLRPTGVVQAIAGRAGAQITAKASPAPALKILKTSAVAADEVRRAVLNTLPRRISELGVDGSGAYEHYNALLARGFPLPRHELAVLDIVREKLPQAGVYCEVGSGLGTLPFLLALSGFRSVGIERDRRRHATAEAIWAELIAKTSIDPRRCRLIEGSFPQAAKAREPNRTDTALIFTDFITTQSQMQLQAIFAGMRRYRYALIDLQRFLMKREASAAQNELLKQILDRGFIELGRFEDRLRDYTLVLLENPAFVKDRNRGLLPRVLQPLQRFAKADA